MGHAPGLWNPSSATVAPKLFFFVLTIERGARWYAPETWNPSSATVARTVVSKPTAGLEQVARKLRTMNSYSRFLSELHSPSPAPIKP